MPTIEELRTKREKLVVVQRALIDLADTEKRNMTAEENAQYDKMDTDFDAIDLEIREIEIGKEEKLARIAKLEAREKELEKILPASIKPEATLSDEERSAKACKALMKNFNQYLSEGERGMKYEEYRALQADSDAKGGFIVAPEQFMNELIKDLENQVFVRKHAKVIPLNKAASLTVPELVRQDNPTWTAEIDTGAADTGMGFKKRQLTPHPLAKRILVSKTLIRQSTLPVEGEVRGGMAYQFGITEENAFMTGDGINQPLGIFVNSANGISNSRDVSAGNTANAIKADGLIETVYTLTASYRGSARWLFHRDALKMIRKLKDGNGDYLWNSGIATGRPSTIIDLPYDESEYAPNTFTTLLYVGALCNWKYYWIVDAMNMELQVLTELYAATNQNGYIGRRETDGAPVHENGFARVTLA